MATEAQFNLAKEQWLAAAKTARTEKEARRGRHSLAVEFQNGGISAKAYFFPNLKSPATGTSPGKLFLDSVEKLGLEGLQEPINHLRNFLGLGRLKLYVTDQLVIWDRVVDIWTLRGSRLGDPQCDTDLILLRKLWDLLEIPEGYRWNVRPDYPLGTPPPLDYRPVMMANWTLSPTKEFPGPQIYLLTFGKNDAVVIDARVPS
ncbi:tryptophan dimethylallyltransferase-domain-containing protein [Aspergillus transmontanensis]|uniref:Tryptophan dimethylallyltransferase-domain-containing protein n=1 Tax=Aspergillus transmontanensis TaxID=1034304 RepID=A0A5N6VD28_9EURO|nr:tryptophan dimethylallyltransferase-domain-containing protein [Aspergillus transmontanensis]